MGNDSCASLWEADGEAGALRALGSVPGSGLGPQGTFSFSC